MPGIKKIQNKIFKSALFMIITISCLFVAQNCFANSADSEDTGYPPAVSGGGMNNQMAQDVLRLKRDIMNSSLEPKKANEANRDNDFPSDNGNNASIGGNSLTAKSEAGIIKGQGQADPDTIASLERINSEAKAIYKKYNPKGNLYEENEQ